MEVLNLKDKEWLEFYVGDLFAVKRPKARSEKQYKLGEVPFIASGNVNNGVIKCCTPFSYEKLDKGNCITVSPVDGSAFYQEYDFLGRGGAGSSILMLYNKKINKYSGIFLTRMLRQTCSKYSYGKMGNQESIKREKILLPIDENGEPDYAFMEEYIREREMQLVQKYVSYIGENRKNGGVISQLEDKEWKSFFVGDLFELVSGKGKGANHLKTTNEGISYLGATNRNNGVLCFVEEVPRLVQKGNCIAFIRNGEGSMGYAVYKHEDFIATSDITLGYAPFLNRYTGIFITTVADKVRGKYNFNYKRSDTRLKKELLQLPVDETGEPDWKYMEQYIREMSIELKLKYLNNKIKNGKYTEINS
jgi:hypothetical protein